MLEMPLSLWYYGQSHVTTGKHTSRGVERSKFLLNFDQIKWKVFYILNPTQILTNMLCHLTLGDMFKRKQMASGQRGFCMAKFPVLLSKLVRS